MPYRPKIRQLSYDEFGIGETFFELQSKRLIYVCCDALYLKDPSQNVRIAQEFEKVIRNYLLQNLEQPSEKTLRKALERAQNYFFKQHLGEDQLKVSAIIIIEAPSTNKETRTLIIAGLGDLKLFSVQNSSKLFFYDPEIPQLPEDLSLKKRFDYITNAIGLPHSRFTFTQIQLNPEAALFIAAYGVYQKLDSSKITYFFTDFNTKKNQLHKLITKSKEKEHLSFLSCIYFDDLDIENPYTSTQNRIQNAPDSKKSTNLEKSFPIWVLKIALVAVLCLMSLEFFNRYTNDSLELSLNQRAPSSVSHSRTPNPEQRLNKEALTLPFLKERANLADLKQKQSQQTKVIHRLESIVKEQDKTLKYLQVQQLERPQTISAKAFKPSKEPDSQNSE